MGVAIAAALSHMASDLVIGVAGTGMMASAHAYRHTQAGYSVVIGSRDPAKGKRCAQQMGGKCVGGSQAEMVEKANFIILAIPPTALRDFIETHRSAIVGKGKMFVDLSVTFSRFGGPL